jgi:hypothetical protein
VASVDGEHAVLDRRQLRDTDDTFVHASSIAVVDTRPGRRAVAQLQVASASAGESFVLRVTFSCTVIDPITVVREVPGDLVPVLESYLRANSNLLNLGPTFGVADVNNFRRAVDAHIRAWCRGRPPQYAGMEIAYEELDVEVPADVVRDAKHQRDYEVTIRNTKREHEIATLTERLQHTQARLTEARQQELEGMKKHFSIEQAKLIEEVLARGPEAIEALYLELGDERYGNSADRAYDQRDRIEDRFRELIGILVHGAHFGGAPTDSRRLIDELVDRHVERPPGGSKHEPTSGTSLIAVDPAYMDKMPLEQPVDRIDRPSDTVQVSVFAPAIADIGTTLLVQVFAHLIERSQQAFVAAHEFDPDATRRGHRTLHLPIRLGARLVLELRIDALEVVDPIQLMVWTGTTESVGFAVEVPIAAPRGATVVGTLSVRCDAIPVGDVTFKLRIRALDQQSGLREGCNPEHPSATSAARRFDRAFLSYAHEDRAKVLESVKVIRALGMHFFQDLLALSPGEEWEARLYRELDACDVLLLFWSRAAKNSPWVRKEVDYALRHRAQCDEARPAIRPVFIEGPPPEPPWDDLQQELQQLHWNDSLLYVVL